LFLVKNIQFNWFYFQAVVLEGKYWKRKFNAVTAEYKKWRLFYRSLLQNGFKERQKLVIIIIIYPLLTISIIV